MCYNPLGYIRKNTGFTTVELCIVILLITVIYFSLSPFVKSIKRMARQHECVRHLREISIGLRSYAIDNGNILPGELGGIFVKGYLKDEDAFDCPFSVHKGTASDPDYVYEKKNDFWAEENKPIVYDKLENHEDGAGNVLYSNGEISAMARRQEAKG